MAVMLDPRVRRALELHREEAQLRRQRAVESGGLSPKQLFERVNAVPLQTPFPRSSRGRQNSSDPRVP